MEQLPYRLSVGLIVVNCLRKVFIAKRLSQDWESQEFSWQMPQGGIEKWQAPEEAALHELWEETSIQSVTLQAISSKWHVYDFPQQVNGWWQGRYRGQKQKWFLFNFYGSDQEINLQTAQPEFSEWRWASKQVVIDSCVPFKRAIYEEVLKEFAHCSNEG